MKKSKTTRYRFPRKLKKAFLKQMSRSAFHAMMCWSYSYFGVDIASGSDYSITKTFEP